MGDGRKRIMRKGLDSAHKRRVQERQSATGGPRREEWDGGRKERRKVGIREGFLGEDRRKRIMRKGRDVGKYAEQNGGRETKENEK
jgi:hypothetical protein